MLEPDDGKLSRPVLRGPDPSNGVWLLGHYQHPELEVVRAGLDYGMPNDNTEMEV